MKRILATFTSVAIVASTANAQVWINEVLANPSGSDSSATAGFEYFELRGTANLSLAGHYLLSLEGQGTGTPGKGDINQFFDLSAFSIGANGFLFARQFGSPYTSVGVGATLVENSPNQGWGQVNGTGSTAAHSSDGAQFDLENSATTIMLINIGSGAVPTLTTDLDTDNDGLVDLLAGWSVVDSVGIMDGVSPLSTDSTYGAINLRLGGIGASATGPIVDVPAGTGTGFYVGRIGDSTGSTSADWVGSVISGSAGSFLLASASDPRFTGKTVADMGFGGLNPVPEPGTLALLGLGGLALFLRRKSR